MVQKIRPRGVIWVPSIPLMLSICQKNNDNIAVQYEDVHDLDASYYQMRLKIKNLPVFWSTRLLNSVQLGQQYKDRER